MCTSWLLMRTMSMQVALASRNMYAMLHAPKDRLLLFSRLAKLYMTAGMPPSVVPAASNHVSPRRRSVEMSPGHASRRRRTKTEQPTLVIMPDGYSLCFAVKETPFVDAAGSGHSSHGRHAVNPVESDRPVADVESACPTADSQHQQAVDSAGPSAGVPVSSPSVEPTLPGSTAAGTGYH